MLILSQQMKTMKNIKPISVVLLGLFLFQCSSDKKETPKDSATLGEITLGVDQSFEPLMKAEKTAFEMQYKYAKINYKFSPENEVIADMLNDKVRGVVVTRDLTTKEKEIFTREAITYRSFNIAGDGIALLANKSNTDTLLTLPELRDLIIGKSTQYTLVVDQANSSNLKFLLDKLKIASDQKLHLVAAGSNPEVINQVKNNPNAIGIIGSNWISDGDNPTSLGFIRSVNVMSVSEGKGLPYSQPFGYNLALKKYPLRREIKYILKEAHQGLGTGFLNYVSGDLGQLIVLKAGLIPLTRPITIRTYQISQ
jgi:phosphate transport system substrate-binding protein